MGRNDNLVAYVAQRIGIWIFFDQSIGIDLKDRENFHRYVVLPREHIQNVSGPQAHGGPRHFGLFWMVLAPFWQL